MELQKLWVSLILKVGDFKNELNEARKYVDGFRGHVDGIMTRLGGLAKGTFLTIGTAAVAAFGLMVKSAIQTNAELERTRLQFTTLMGDADKAQQHVKDLFEIAKKTPFETQPIINASLTLQTFGGEALNTKDNIMLLGDTAAAVGAPIDDLAFWVGRLYGNLQGGQPFGEAAMRLQELAVLTPQARKEMEAMQKAGKSAAEIFAFFQKDLEKFNGAMEKQATTWEGLMSTLSDSIKSTLAEALEPFFETGKEGLESLIELLNDPAIIEGIRELGRELGKLADGISKTFGFLINEAAAQGLGRMNNQLMEQLGLSVELQREIQKEASDAVGAGLIATGEEGLKVQQEVNRILEERYGFEIQIVQARSEAEDWFIGEKARREEAIVRERVRAYEYLVKQYGDTADGGSLLARQTAWVREEQNRARLETQAYTEELERQRAATEAAKAAQEAYAAAFQSVIGDFGKELPGADKPLITPERTVSIVTGGPTAAQAKLLKEYTKRVEALQEEIGDLTNGIGTYGKEQDEVNELIADAQGELQHYRKLMAPLEGIVGEVSTAHQGLKVNVDAVHQGIYDQLVQMGAAPSVITAFGVAVGILSEEQAEAALQAAAVQIEIERLAGLIAEGLPIDQAMTQLDNFIAKIENGAVGAVEQMAVDVPEHMSDMHREAMLEVEGLSDDVITTLEGAADQTPDIGVSIVEGVIAGVNSRQEALLARLRALMEEGIGSAISELEAYSPSRRFMELGVSIVEGLIAGIDKEEETLYNKLAAVADELYSIGANVFDLQNTALQTQIDAAETGLEAALDQMETFLSHVVDVDVLRGLPLAEQLRILTMMSGQFRGTPEANLWLAEALAAATELNGLTEEQIRQQEELAALEEQRAKLNFLQQQIDLLNLIKDNNLDTAILDGLALGIDANMTDIIAAMTEAMTELVNKTEQELGIASPSSVFEDIGINMMLGLMTGIEKSAAALEESFGKAMAPALTMAAGASSIDNSRSSVNYGGYHVHVTTQGDSDSALKAIWRGLQ
jgi:hypothetical protein